MSVSIESLQSEFDKHPGVVALRTALKEMPGKNIFLQGLQGSESAVIFSSLQKQLKCSQLFILNDLEEAGYFYNDLVQSGGTENTFFFPSSYKRAIKYGQPDPANEILRTEVLSRLQHPDPAVQIVTYPDAIAEKVVSLETLKKKTLSIVTSEKIDRIFVADRLREYGFTEVDYVYEPGQFAVRGSIFDVFSFSCEYPYRVDFFGNEAESIRTFDVESQLSKEKINRIQIVPTMQQDENNGASLLNFLPGDAIIACKDIIGAIDRIDFIRNEIENHKHLETGSPDSNLLKKLITGNHFAAQFIDFKQVEFGAKSTKIAQIKIHFNSSPQPGFHKNFDLVGETLRRFLKDNYTLYILSDSEKQTQRIKAIFEDRGEVIPFTGVQKTLHEGFVDHDLKMCCFTDHQIFDRFHKYNLKSDKARSGEISLTLKELNQFHTGDYVVHIDHGVGRFAGLVRTEINGKMQEVIKLRYLNDDIIFVSIHSLHKLSKYRGKEGEPPRINKLGTGAWERLKENTKKKVKDIARDLITLYAKRREEKGFEFAPDTYLQQELEASFIYEDTPDQLKTTTDVKQDMEKDIPMDRLICGDVGFGKTEIAIRATFKAVTDGKQVAVLVPTTVLALQHYKTFSERLKDFPCTVDYLSRARKASEAKEILSGLKTGKIDILIGTHKLIGKEVVFKDLGLLIIDEEQKFGVSVKEKLKQLKVNVDTLTMTATPIPRTLQFSLLGARDLSVISTPPPNRYPIQTEVHVFNEDLIRETVNFEMSRNGQVYFIHNRVQNIYEIEALIKRLVPDARIAVGHGQMDPKRLEKTIIDFIDLEYDVLIATTIVESGIDIPNVNTIIINNAQYFGLSDLHQLRGRVGRSNKKAFCYLLAPPLSTLPTESRRRLQAIENFSELGSGIHIAMQDLDIRGAGNLLGAEQSGFIADLGYETYQKILAEAVQELKNEEFTDLYNDHELKKGEKRSGEQYVLECQIESDLELMFPSMYIPDDSERITLYRELDSMENDSDIQYFISKLEDRFGKIPEEGRELIQIVRLRRMAKKLGIEKIALKSGRMIIYLISDSESPYYQSAAFDKLLTFIQKHPRICQLRELNDKRSIVIQQVTSVETACRILEEMTIL
ncbi:MAG: transcription-repair coupling factor [Candidatus Azobacteroides sp.]|nr:transcription-repair coupling factor [Candidatus Azobacteroides sp.]